jgi:hypothetical protein
MSVLLFSLHILFFTFYVATNISGEKHIILSFSLLFRRISLFIYRVMDFNKKDKAMEGNIFFLSLSHNVTSNSPP